MGRRSVLQSIREAIAGSQQDFTEGSLSRAITLLAIPMVLEMMMESLFGIVDVFFVARLGADAIATVGVTESLLLIVFAVAIGLSMSTTAMVARRVGEGDHEGASDAAMQALLVGLVIAVPTGIGGALLAPRLLSLMSAPAGVIENGWTYTAIILGGNVTILGLFLINAIFRGAGDAAIAMRSLWLANLINMILDPCLIFGLGPFPEMGLMGAAVGTTIGRGVGVLYQLSILFGGKGRIAVGRRHMRLHPGVMLRLLRVSLGGILQMVIATASYLGLVRILTPFGSSALAAYTIALRIIVVTILPSWGMSNAAATLVGQNLGAGKPDRAERSAWLTGFYNMIFLAVIGAVFVVFARPIIAAFLGDGAKAGAAELEYGAECLRTIACGFLFYAYGMVFGQAFNGAGDTWTPTWMNFGCFWLLELPLAWLLSHPLGMGPRGVFIAVAIAFSTLALVGGVLFRRGGWKARIV